MNRTDLRALAEERLEDARAMLAVGRYGAAYYIVGYAVECGLKACIAKLTQAEDFYDKKLASSIFVHDLQRLANAARLKDIFEQASIADQQFGPNWAQACTWNEESRYDVHTKVEAEQMFSAIEDAAHGVMQCIRQYW